MSDDGSEGSASPQRPQRRIKKVMVLSSASETESDESDGPTRTRKRRLRVVSDDDGASSSGSSVGARRRRNLPQLRDSDADSDSSGGAPPAAPKPASGFASDSSEGNSDKCSICLMRFTEQEVGTPVNCEHIFCLDCITEWSKNVNTCPVDRITFDSIVVRTCAGGRVLRSDPVQVVERRPSVEMLVIEDPTVCEICGSMENEDSMLLCDGCDLGFHMQCLTPPLLEIPIDQWHCPSCVRHGLHNVGSLEDIIYLSEVEDLFSGITDMEMPRGPRPAPLRQTRERGERRSTRNQPAASEPSTSSGRRGAASDAEPRARARAPRRRRKPARRRTKTVIIEYEIEENGKFPITRRVKRTVRKRKIRARRPRTAARRTLVRASVRAQLAALAQPAPHAASVTSEVSELHIRRARAGITSLSLFGSERDLEYFSDDEADSGASEAASTAVARPSRPNAAVFSAYRQARRKMISVPSPPHASAAPDLLSDILERQTLLHSKRSVVSVSVDGRVDFKLREDSRLPDRDTSRDTTGPQFQPKRDEKPEGTRSGGERVDVNKSHGPVRSTPAHPGQRGGWGGGYSGNYHREQSANNFGRGYDNNYGPNGEREPAYPARGHTYGGPPRREDDGWSSFPRRPPGPPCRPRRPERPESRPPHRPRPGPGALDPLDMRVAPQAAFRPLPEPPAFRFDGLPEDKSEDERSDGSLVIDTEKYDPTEPTVDEDEEPAPPPTFGPLPQPPPPPLPPPVPAAPLPAPAPLPAGLLDTAVRQALLEHRSLVAPAPPAGSDDDEDGDCPNFSIYSATSVHIASAGSLAPPAPRAARLDDMADLVQEDDEPPPPPPPPPLDKLEEYKEKLSKRCPITPNKRDPIKIKLNAPSLIKRVSLYDEEDTSEPVEPSEAAAEPEPGPDRDPATVSDPPEPEDEGDKNDELPADEPAEDDEDRGDEDKNEDIKNSEADESFEDAKTGGETPTDEKSPERESNEELEEEPEKQNGLSSHSSRSHSPRSSAGEEEPDAAETAVPESETAGLESETELPEPETKVPQPETDEPGAEGAPEKMTESISETEDERSYTPCLDENQSKDTSRGSELRLEGDALGTELISEDEANGVFSDAGASPTPAPAPDGKKKKRKESKKDGKGKIKGKKDVAFRKLSKAGRERSYRDKDRRRRSASGSPRRAASERRRREKRKDLERYDVRSVVTEKRKKLKDPFGRDVSPARSLSGSARSRSPARLTPEPAPRPRSSTPEPAPPPEPRRVRKRRKSPDAARRRSPTPRRRSASPRRRSASPRRRSATPRRRSASPRRRSARRRSPSPGRLRKRRRTSSPKPKAGKKKKRARSPPAPAAPRRKSPKRKKKRRSPSRSPSLSPGGPPPPGGWSPLSVDSRLLSPRTPPAAAPRRAKRKRKEPRRRDRLRHKRPKDAPAPSKEVFTSGDNILVSVSFAEQTSTAAPLERRKHPARRDKRRRRAAAPEDSAKPVAIIDLERSPFRELTPSPKNVIVLSDSEHGEKEPAVQPPPEAPAVGPKTPPSPPAAPSAAPVKFTLAVKPAKPAPNPLREDEEPAPQPDAPQQPDASGSGSALAPLSPDAYDPFEPTRSASASPAARAASPERPSMTLEAAQRTNMSADDVLARRPLSPIEKVMALLQSTRDESPEPVPSAPAAPPAPPPPAPRVVLPEPARAQPKLFLAKPSPIKSNPIKPMQATKISLLPLPRHEGGDSPYSPGSSDFGDLFSPPPAGKRDAFDSLFGAKPNKRKDKSHAKVPVKYNRKKGKTQVGVKLDDDNLKILDELPSSAVEMQVKSKFLKKLNRQERVVEEVKLVLKPHYTRKRVSKEEYKDILRRAVPKICHNKTGEINPAKIQALVEAYVKKARKKHKLGLA